MLAEKLILSEGVKHNWAAKASSPTGRLCIQWDLLKFLKGGRGIIVGVSTVIGSKKV